MIQLNKRMHGMAVAVMSAALLSLTACSKSKDKENLPEGTVLLNEKFDKSTSEIWHTETRGPVTYSIKNGWYTIDIATENTYVAGVWSTSKTFFQKGEKQNIEVVQKQTDGHGYDKAGLIFWLKDNQNYLTFQIGPKEFRVHQILNNQGSFLIGWTASSAIKGNMGDENKLKVSLADGKILFFINDVQVGTINAGPVETLDKIGIRIDKAYTTPHSIFQYDYVRAWKSK